MQPSRVLPLTLFAFSCSLGCDDVERPAAPADDGVYGYANGCYAVEGFDGDGKAPTFLVASAGGDGFGFAGPSSEAATHFTMRATDLGTYLFYDPQQRTLTAVPAEGKGYRLARTATLESPLTQLDDTFRSPAEWQLEPSVRDSTRYLSLIHI